MLSKTASFVLLLLLLAIAAGALVLAGRLAATDVYIPIHGRPESTGPWFCGSAYDVSLIKRDGYMGGEIPAQAELIDRLCVSRANRAMLKALGPGAIAVISGAGAYVAAKRARSRRLAR